MFSEFQFHVESARGLAGIANGINGMTAGKIDVSEMYRGAVVLAVSAIDKYIHAVIIDRSADIFMGRRKVPTVESRVALSIAKMAELMAIESALSRENMFRQLVAEKISKETFQRAEAISQAMSGVGVPHVWENGWKTEAKRRKAELNLVVNRRNKIAHECDADPTDPQIRLPIFPEDVASACDAVIAAGTVVFNECSAN